MQNFASGRSAYARIRSKETIVLLALLPVDNSQRERGRAPKIVPYPGTVRAAIIPTQLEAMSVASLAQPCDRPHALRSAIADNRGAFLAWRQRSGFWIPACRDQHLRRHSLYRSRPACLRKPPEVHRAPANWTRETACRRQGAVSCYASARSR